MADVLATPKPDEGGSPAKQSVAAPNAFGAAATVGETTKGNQGNEESLREAKVQSLVFFAAFCKKYLLHRRRHACHYSAPNLPFSSAPTI
jgi:hypothetical protein